MLWLPESLTSAHTYTEGSGLSNVSLLIVLCPKLPLLLYCCRAPLSALPPAPHSHTHIVLLPQAEALLSSQRAAVEEAEQAVQEALRLLREAEVGSVCLSASTSFLWAAGVCDSTSKPHAHAPTTTNGHTWHPDCAAGVFSVVLLQKLATAPE